MKAWFFAARMIGAAVGFVTAIILARLMPLDEFGRYALIFALGGVANMLLLAWVETSITRFEKTAEFKGRSISGGLGLMLVIQAGAFALAGVLYVALPEPHGTFGALIALQCASASLFELALAGLRLQSRGGAFTLITLLRAVLSLAAGAGAAQAGFGYEVVTLAIIAGVLTAGVLGFAVVGVQSGVTKPSSLLVTRFLRYGGPLGVARSRGLLANAISQLALTTFAGPDSAGAYAAAFNLTSRSIQQIALVLLSIWAPDIFRSYEADGGARANRVMQQLMAFLLLLVTPLAIIFVAGGETVATIVFGADKAAAIAPFLQILAIAVVINAIQASVISVPFMIVERTVLHLWLAVGFSVFHVLVTLWAVSALGEIGAAVASLATAVFSTAVVILVIERFFKIRYDWRDLLRILIATAVSVPFVLMSGADDDHALAIAWMLLSGLVFLLALIAMKYSATKKVTHILSKFSRTRP